MRPAPKRVWVAGLVVAAGLFGLGGPRWSEREEPTALPAAVADHREAARLTMLVFGDSGSGGRDQRAVAGAMAASCRDRGGCDLGLVAGDLVYGVGWLDDIDAELERKLERPYESLGRIDLWGVAGNHDWRKRGLVDAEVRWTSTSQRFRMLSHDYEVPQLPAWLAIYGLDTTKIVHEHDDGQIERARAVLCDTDGWRLLFGHHPVYTSGYHGRARGELVSVRNALLEPLIERCGVQLYLAGHDHHQEHLSSPAFEQVIQGAAARLRSVRTLDDGGALQQLAAASRLGFALIEIDPDRLVLRFVGLDSGGRPETFHCRSFNRSDFADRETRSRACGL